MTQQESELIAMREMAAWRIKKILGKEQTALLETYLFDRCARGLRLNDWREVVDKLCADGALVRGVSTSHGKPTLSLAQPQTTQQE